MEARLPEDKLGRLKEEIDRWITRRKAKKREILSIVGSLQHAAKVVRWGRAFLSRMYATVAKPKEMHYFTKLDVQFCSNICWWHTFLTEWNGVSLLRWDDGNWTPENCIQRDAFGSWGCGAFWDNHWLQWCWPQKWAHHNIMVKELIPIVLNCVVWGRQLAGRRVLIECDNSGVVAAVSKQSVSSM